MYLYALKTSMAEEMVILVDENDKQVGLMAKMEAHEKALCTALFRSLFLMIKRS